MSAIVEFVSDVVEDVVDAVGDVVESVGEFVSDAIDTVGDVVQAVIDDPLPVLLSVAGSFVGIPPMVTNAAITAARGGGLEDIALSVGTAYFAPMATNAISSTLSSTIGDAIINETVSDLVVDAVSKGLVGGTIAELRDGDFTDGFAGGFTGTMVQGGITELTSFVQPEIVSMADSLGFDEGTARLISNVGTKALTAGVTAEITGRGDFETQFTGSLINSGANLAANTITNTISDQFRTAIDIDEEIIGAREGDQEDRAILTAELDESWADTAGVVGTGAGIPDELVDEVQVSDLGYETPSNREDPMVVESMSEDALSTDLTGYSSPTVSLSEDADLLLPTEDVSDLETEYGVGSPVVQLPRDEVAVEDLSLDELPIDDLEDVQQIYGQPVVAEETAPVDQINVIDQYEVPRQAVTEAQEYDIYPEEVPLYEERPIGGLGAVALAPDVYEDVTESLITPKTEESIIDIAGREESPVVDRRTPSLGGLASGFMPTGGGQAIVTGALNQILKPALRQGITKALRGTPARPANRKPAPRQAPARMTPAQLAAARQTRPTPLPTSVAPKPGQPRVAPPKRKDVATLTPVTNIAGLTSLLKNKG